MRTLPRVSALVFAITLTTGLAVGAGVPSSRADTVTDLYVRSSGCSDTGSGSAAQPFCTIDAAAGAAQPGETVHVAAGSYPTATISVSGTPADPITFEADGVVELGFQMGSTGTGLAIVNSHDVKVTGFRVLSNVAVAVLVDGSSDITVDSGVADGGERLANPFSSLPAVQVTGSSSDVTISRLSIQGFPVGVAVDPGATGVVVTTNTITPNGGPSVMATGTSDTVITSNTMFAWCTLGVDISGGATGTVVENNVLQSGVDAIKPEPCPEPANAAGISVAADSVQGTVTDYNLIDPAGGGALYDWDGTGYSDLGKFAAATGQGSHDLAADPLFGQEATGPGNDFWFPLTSGSPALDSANADAPGELATDEHAWPRADDPDVPNTGTGDGFYDRGAIELEGGLGGNGHGLTVTTTGPLTVTATAPNLTSAWPTNGAPIGLWTFSFGDGTVVQTSDRSVKHAYQRAGAYQVGATANYSDFSGELDQDGPLLAVVGAAYAPVEPVRVLDTRSAVGVSTRTPVAAGATLSLPLPSVNGVAAADVTAVVLNVAALSPAKPGWLGVYPGGESPGTANLAFTAGHAAENLVTVPVENGKIDFRNGSSGTVHVVADLQGYYAAAGDGFAPQQPSRVLDTRNGTGVPAGALGAGKVLKLSLAGKVPAGTDAVALNVTALGPAKNGYLTVYPDSPSRPVVSNVAFASGQTVGDMTIVPLVNGVADVFNGSGGTVNVVADLMGSFSSTAPDLFVPYGPVRFADTRHPDGSLPAHGTVEYNSGDTYWNGCVPSCPAEGAVVYNVTATEPAKSGYLTVYPGGTRPEVSTVAFTPGETVSDLVTLMGGPSDGTAIYNGSDGTVNLILDEQGYYIQP